MVNDVDQNDNGMIEFNEFLQMMSTKMRSGDSEDELKEAFKWVRVLRNQIPGFCIFSYSISSSPTFIFEGFILMWCFMISHRTPLLSKEIQFHRCVLDDKLRNLRPPENDENMQKHNNDDMLNEGIMLSYSSLHVVVLFVEHISDDITA